MRRIDRYDGHRVTYHYRSHRTDRVEHETVDVDTFKFISIKPLVAKGSGAPEKIIYHPQSGWFEDTPLKGGTEAGCPLKGVEEGTSLLGLRSVCGTTTALC